MNIKIKVINRSINVGVNPVLFEINGKLDVSNKLLSKHDVAAYLFAIEFAANNYSELPMRVHIEEQ